jgi:ribonuclease E
MGKISRFGLMELSRQRLRPSLSEGSHVTCPRCSGTGHIRDTESSALQVLRIIQEEAMKENSAAIHVQVPVDVAAFLLNEKRGEVLKIENRHRITVILIPNKHLETPHYKLERIKHDDPRLEEAASSYTMAESTDTDMAYAKRQKEEAKPRQEAVVKTITPAQPAPVVERPVKVEAPAAAPAAAPVVQPAAEQGFFAKLRNFLFGAPVPMTPAPAAAPVKPAEPASTERGERNGRGQRNARGGRNGAGKGREREDRDQVAKAAPGDETAKPVDADGKPARQPRKPREQREPREAREPRETRDQADAQAPAAPRAERGERPERAERPERQPRQPRERAERTAVAEAKADELNVVQATSATSVTIASTGPNGEQEIVQEQIVKTVTAIGPNGDEVDGEGDEPRRRRRRGGRNRNRRDRDGAEIIENESGEEGVAPAFAPVADEEAAKFQAESRTAKPRGPKPAKAAALGPWPFPTTASVKAAADKAAAEQAAIDKAAAEQVAAKVRAEQAAAEAARAEAAAKLAENQAPWPFPTAQSVAQAAAGVVVEQAVAAPAPAPVAPVAPVAPAPVEAAPTPVAAAPAPQPVIMPAPVAPVAPAPVAPAPVQTAAAPAVAAAPQADLGEVLAQAGLQLAATDPEKMRAAQEAAAQVQPPVRMGRTRKVAPPPAAEPLVQVDTTRQ